MSKHSSKKTKEAWNKAFPSKCIICEMQKYALAHGLSHDENTPSHICNISNSRRRHSYNPNRFIKSNPIKNK